MQARIDANLSCRLAKLRSENRHFSTSAILLLRIAKLISAVSSKNGLALCTAEAKFCCRKLVPETLAGVKPKELRLAALRVYGFRAYDLRFWSLGSKVLDFSRLRFRLS